MCSPAVHTLCATHRLQQICKGAMQRLCGNLHAIKGATATTEAGSLCRIMQERATEVSAPGRSTLSMQACEHCSADAHSRQVTYAASSKGKVLAMTAFSLPVLSSLATSCIMRPSGLTKPKWYLGPSPNVPNASLQVCKTRIRRWHTAKLL